MKKGSRARKCRCCGKTIFWDVPTETILGLQTVERKSVRPWKYYKPKDSKTGYYYCVCEDCFNKIQKGEILI